MNEAKTIEKVTRFATKTATNQPKKIYIIISNNNNNEQPKHKQIDTQKRMAWRRRRNKTTSIQQPTLPFALSGWLTIELYDSRWAALCKTLTAVYCIALAWRSLQLKHSIQSSIASLRKRMNWVFAATLLAECLRCFYRSVWVFCPCSFVWYFRSRR